MTTFSDNFNRADGGLGANYTRARGSTNGISIVSNMAQIAKDDNDNAYIRSAETFASDQELTVTLQDVISLSGQPVYAEIYCRASGVDGTFQAYSVYSNGLDDFAIMRYNSDTPTTLKAVTVSFSNGDTLGIRVTGSNPVVIGYYKNGSLVDSYSDTSGSRISSGGKPAIGGYTAAASTTHTGKMDDATGGDVSAGGASAKLLSMLNNQGGF